MVEATPHSRTQQPMRFPESVQSGFDAGQPLWTITVWPVTPHSESSVPMVNGMALQSDCIERRGARSAHCFACRSPGAVASITDGRRAPDRSQ